MSGLQRNAAAKRVNERASRPKRRKSAAPPDEHGDGNQREEMGEEDDLYRLIGLAEPLGRGVPDRVEKDRRQDARDPKSYSIGARGRRCGRCLHEDGLVQRSPVTVSLSTHSPGRSRLREMLCGPSTLVSIGSS